MFAPMLDIKLIAVQNMSTFLRVFANLIFFFKFYKLSITDFFRKCDQNLQI